MSNIYRFCCLFYAKMELLYYNSMISGEHRAMKKMVYVIFLLAFICFILLFTLYPERQTFVQSEKDLVQTLHKMEKSDEVIERSVAVKPLFLPDDVSEERTEEITHIVLHFSSAVGHNYNDPYDIHTIRHIFIDYGVSCHYMIDRDGTIYELVPEDRVAYHAGKGTLPDKKHYEDRLNQFSIGIELLAIGTKEEMGLMIDEETYDKIAREHIGYTEAQYEALNELITDITLRYDTLEKTREHTIGHDEYAPDRRTDPGSLFEWEKIGLQQ